MYHHHFSFHNFYLEEATWTGCGGNAHRTTTFIIYRCHYYNMLVQGKKHTICCLSSDEYHSLLCSRTMPCAYRLNWKEGSFIIMEIVTISYKTIFLLAFYRNRIQEKKKKLTKKRDAARINLCTYNDLKTFTGCKTHVVQFPF